MPPIRRIARILRRHSAHSLGNSWAHDKHVDPYKKAPSPKTMPRSHSPGPSFHSLINTCLIPASINICDTVAFFPSDSITVTISMGFAKGTVRNYANAVKSFLTFCDDHNVDHQLRLPADEQVLWAFAASMATSYAGSTANNIFSGLKTWRAIRSAPWLGSPCLQLFFHFFFIVIIVALGCCPMLQLRSQSKSSRTEKETTHHERKEAKETAYLSVTKRPVSLT
jgi:hypothetical protein